MNIKSYIFSVSRTSNLQSSALLLMRLVLGIIMLTHGWAKLINFESLSQQFMDPIGFGSEFALLMILFAELGCSILLLLGLFTRWATIPLIIGMCVAAFIAHAGDSFQNKELPVLYLSMYVVLLLAGPGKFSLDALVGKTKKRGSYKVVR